MDTYFLDVETIHREIVLTGILLPDGRVEQLYPGRAEDLLRILPERARLVTFNGHVYDLPLIRQQLGVDLRARMHSVDLRWYPWGYGSRRLHGGLKDNEGFAGYVRHFPILMSWDFERRWNYGDLWTCCGYNEDDLKATRAVWDFIANWEASEERQRAKREVGFLIWVARLNAGLSQQAVAGSLGVSPSTIAAWEQGRRLPARHAVLQLTAVLGHPAEQIFGWWTRA